MFRITRNLAQKFNFQCLRCWPVIKCYAFTFMGSQVIIRQFALIENYARKKLSRETLLIATDLIELIANK